MIVVMDILEEYGLRRRKTLEDGKEMGGLTGEYWRAADIDNTWKKKRSRTESAA